MEQHLSQHIAQYLLSAVGLLLSCFLARAIKLFKSVAQTTCKANLAFEEVSDRKPEYGRMYEAWMRQGAVIAHTPAKARHGGGSHE